MSFFDTHDTMQWPLVQYQKLKPPIPDHHCLPSVENEPPEPDRLQKVICPAIWMDYIVYYEL